MNAEQVPLPVLVKPPEAARLPRLALELVVGFAVVKLLAQLLAIAVTAYGSPRLGPAVILAVAGLFHCARHSRTSAPAVDLKWTGLPASSAQRRFSSRITA